MEETDLLKLAGVSSSSVAIVLIIYRILRAIQGKKLVSSCCGKKMEMGVSITPMTPIEEPVVVEIKNPMGTGLETKKDTQ